MRRVRQEAEAFGNEEGEREEYDRLRTGNKNQRKAGAGCVWGTLLSHCPAWMLFTESSLSLRSKQEKEKETLKKKQKEIITKKEEKIAASSVKDEVQTVWGAAALRMHAEAQVQAEDDATPKYFQYHLQQVFDILDGFLNKTNVGEFPARLHLVRLFALQLQQQSLSLWEAVEAVEASRFSVSVSSSSSSSSGHSEQKDDMMLVKHDDKEKDINNMNTQDLQEQEEEDFVGGAMHARIMTKKARVVFGVWYYYSQFLPLVRKFQGGLKDPIITRIRGEVKIGKWDQLGTYALIDHSEKVHRKLNKLIREYQNSVLDLPIETVLRKDIMGDLASEHGDLTGATEIPGPTAIFPCIRPLESASVSTTGGLGDSIDGTAYPVPVPDRAAEEVYSIVEDGLAAYGALTITNAQSSARARSQDGIPKLDLKAIVDESSTGGALTSYPQVLRVRTLGNRMDKYIAEILTTIEEEEEEKEKEEDRGSVGKTIARTVKFEIEKEKNEEGEEIDAEDEKEEEEEEEQVRPIYDRFRTSARYGLLAADTSEELCGDIFSRLAGLRSESVRAMYWVLDIYVNVNVSVYS